MLTCLVLVASPFNSHGDQLTGKTVQIYSGDTIEILVDQNPVRVHMYGIDCPEGYQAFALEAKEYTSKLAYGKVVTIHVTNSDRRGGKIGTVMLPGEKSLNCELIKAGLAWWNQYSAPDDRILQALEKSARNSRVGLWSDPDPVPPWEYKKSIQTPSGDIPGQTIPSPSIDDDTTVFVTSTGEKYHRYGCRYLMKSMIPIRLGEAKTSGLVPCPICDPPR